jgi:hypothetical protein
VLSQENGNLIATKNSGDESSTAVGSSKPTRLHVFRVGCSKSAGVAAITVATVGQQNNTPHPAVPNPQTSGPADKYADRCSASSSIFCSLVSVSFRLRCRDERQQQQQQQQ